MIIAIESSDILAFIMMIPAFIPHTKQMDLNIFGFPIMSIWLFLDFCFHLLPMQPQLTWGEFICLSVVAQPVVTGLLSWRHSSSIRVKNIYQNAAFNWLFAAAQRWCYWKQL